MRMRKQKSNEIWNKVGGDEEYEWLNFYWLMYIKHTIINMSQLTYIVSYIDLVINKNV